MSSILAEENVLNFTVKEYFEAIKLLNKSSGYVNNPNIRYQNISLGGSKFLRILMSRKLGVSNIDTLNDALRISCTEGYRKSFYISSSDLRILYLMHDFLSSKYYVAMPRLAFDDRPSKITCVNIQVPMGDANTSIEILHEVVNLLHKICFLDIVYENIRLKAVKCIVPGCSNSACLTYPRICGDHLLSLSDKALTKVTLGKKINLTDVTIYSHALRTVDHLIYDSLKCKSNYVPFVKDHVEGICCVMCEGNFFSDVDKTVRIRRASTISNRICNNCACRIDYNDVEQDYICKVFTWDQFIENKLWENYIVN